MSACKQCCHDERARAARARCVVIVYRVCVYAKQRQRPSWLWIQSAKRKQKWTKGETEQKNAPKIQVFDFSVLVSGRVSVSSCKYEIYSRQRDILSED